MTPSDLQNLSATLRTERERCGLTVRQLAELAGIPPTTLFRIESGQVASPKPDNLQRLARALHIDVEVLYATAGFSVPDQLPELATYLRSKYGMSGDDANSVEDFVDFVRDRNKQPSEEGQNDNPGDQVH